MQQTHMKHDYVTFRLLLKWAVGSWQRYVLYWVTLQQLQLV